jgi:hypothetical protein
MINSKIAQAMKDAEALGFEFRHTRTHSVPDNSVHYEFTRTKGGTLSWDPARGTWSFNVWGEGRSAADAINAASAKSQACTSAPAE